MLPHLHYIQSLSCHVAGNTNIRGILIRYTKWWKLAKILLFIYVLLHKNDEKLAKILSNHIAWHWIRHIITGSCVGLAVTQHHSITLLLIKWTTQTTGIYDYFQCSDNAGIPSNGVPFKASLLLFFLAQSVLQIGVLILSSPKNNKWRSIIIFLTTKGMGHSIPQSPMWVKNYSYGTEPMARCPAHSVFVVVGLVCFSSCVVATPLPRHRSTECPPPPVTRHTVVP